MQQKYNIELVEEHNAVNFYSIHLDEEELSELERFFKSFQKVANTMKRLTSLLHGLIKSEKKERWRDISVRKESMETVLVSSQLM